MNGKGLDIVKSVTEGEYHITPKIEDGETVRYIDIQKGNLRPARLLNVLNNARLLEDGSDGIRHSDIPLLRLVSITRSNGPHNYDVATFEDLNY